MPGARQSSVGRVESISFKFRIPYTCGLEAREKRKKEPFIIHGLNLIVKKKRERMLHYNKPQMEAANTQESLT